MRLVMAHISFEAGTETFMKAALALLIKGPAELARGQSSPTV